MFSVLSVPSVAYWEVSTDRSTLLTRQVGTQVHAHGPRQADVGDA